MRHYSDFLLVVIIEGKASHHFERSQLVLVAEEMATKSSAANRLGPDQCCEETATAVSNDRDRMAAKEAS